MTETRTAPQRNLYGRRRGHRLRSGHKDLIDNRLADISVPGVDPEENPERKAIDPALLFPGKKALWLEIGFGGGEHLLHQAEQNPDCGLIGCEPYINGVAKLLASMERRGIQNVRLVAGDARDLMDILPDGSVERLFLLYPDPWPKTRHHKRRFVNPENIEAFERVMAPGAVLRVASDIPDYIRWTLLHLVRRPGWRWDATTPEDWRDPWDDWPGTRYEAKAFREGRTPAYLTFTRIG